MIASRRARQAVIIPQPNCEQASLVSRLSGSPVTSLAELCAVLNRAAPLPQLTPARRRLKLPPMPDLADVRGQARARRALEIAAAGAHHMLMMGPPGTGKSMLAQRLVSILPAMSEDEALGSASIRSLCQRPVTLDNWRLRPFQSPHHTVSAVALAGGGGTPRPGEISLAHNGILFLDELTEFRRGVIEVLREPLETGQIHISRAAGNAVFPASFQLVAAMNPCPGGCESIRRCDCSAQQLDRYRGKLSAPLLDRIDIQIELSRLTQAELLDTSTAAGEPSAPIRARVEQARKRQIKRQGCLNARLGNRELSRFCRIDELSASLLADAIDKLRLSARSYHKLLRIARTLADLEAAESIAAAHISEAISYRQQERQRW